MPVPALVSGRSALPFPTINTSKSTLAVSRCVPIPRRRISTSLVLTEPHDRKGRTTRAYSIHLPSGRAAIVRR
jgi:hypothetical protein